MEIELKRLVEAKVGDPCPNDDCDGVFERISFHLMYDHFSAEAICSLCTSEWTLREKGYGRDA